MVATDVEGAEVKLSEVGGGRGCLEKENVGLLENLVIFF